MIEQDYNAGDLVEWRKPQFTGGYSSRVGIVLKKVEPPDLSTATNWYPAYIVMEPGGQQHTVSHLTMRRIK